MSARKPPSSKGTKDLTEKKTMYSWPQSQVFILIYPIRNYLSAGFLNHSLKLEYLYSFLPSHWNRERYVLTIMRKRTIQITTVAHYSISGYSKACWDGKNGYLLLKILKSHELLGPACSTNWSVHVPFK